MNKTDKLYYCARFCYHDGTHGLVMETEVDSLPATIYSLHKVLAPNKEEALYRWVAQLETEVKSLARTGV